MHFAMLPYDCVTDIFDVTYCDTGNQIGPCLNPVLGMKCGLEKYQHQKTATIGAQRGAHYGIEITS